MAYTTINKHTAHFNTKLYTGNGGTQSITGVGFQPDFTWIKNRSATENHFLQDAVRGSTKRLNSNNTNAEATEADGVTAFTSDGFNLGYTTEVNGNGNNIVSWNWKAGGAGSSNSDGDITSTVSANTTSGFSIVKYTGTGTYQNTVGHGLGAVPKMIIVKGTSFSRDWTVYHESMGNTKNMHLNDNSTQATEPSWGNTTPTSSVFTISGASQANWYDTNKSGEDYIAYCFAEKTGYSKFGSYTGNGGTDNAFIYTGFKPAFFITKRFSDSANWVLWESARTTSTTPGAVNPIEYFLYPNDNGAEGSGSYYLDFLSNGIKIKDGNSKWGADGSTYIFMAFGQSLVGSNNIPCTAR